MIREGTNIPTAYNIYCDQCGAAGPDGTTEVDAHLLATETGWEIIGDSHVCPDPSHAALKTMLKFLVDMKVQYIPLADPTECEKSKQK